jgi:ATP-dependent Clp protease adapter protein ClpS
VLLHLLAQGRATTKGDRRLVWMGGRGDARGQALRVASRIRTEEQNATRTELMPLYHTVVHNCDCHTFQDVIFGLMRIVGTGMRDAELKAREIDFFGRGIVATTTLEVAEHYAQRLHTEVVSASGTLLGTSIEPA